LIRWRSLLLAHDGGRPAAIAQLNRRGVATEHCCRGVDDTNTATADSNADKPEPSVAGGGEESGGCCRQCTRPAGQARS